MRIKTVLIALTVLACAGFAAEKKPAKQKSPTPNTTITVPTGATRIDDHTYSHTDANGKKWIYRQTPFGWARLDADADRPPRTPPSTVVTKVIEDGDSLRFERPGPYGVYKWTRKKSELTESEQELWKQSREKTTAAQ